MNYYDKGHFEWMENWLRSNCRSKIKQKKLIIFPQASSSPSSSILLLSHFWQVWRLEPVGNTIKILSEKLLKTRSCEYSVDLKMPPKKLLKNENSHWFQSHRIWCLPPWLSVTVDPLECWGTRDNSWPRTQPLCFKAEKWIIENILFMLGQVTR